MRERLLNHQQKPRPFGMKTRRLNAVTRFLMVLFTMFFPIMLFSQGTGASNYPISFWYVSWSGSAGYYTEIPINSSNAGDVIQDGVNDGKVQFSYNSANNTGTLTLNGMNFNGWIESELDELIIEFTGTNRLSGTGGTGNNGYIRNKKTSGEATLTLIPANSSSTLYIQQETASYSVVDGFTLNLDGGTIPTYPSYYSPFFFDSSTKQYKYGDIPGYPLLETITFTATPSYMVWIGGSGASGISQATGLATDATFASANVTYGTASFDSSTNTLTLTGAALSGDIWSGLDNLNINLINSNTITHDNYGGADSPIFSINSGSLNIETTDGTGSLTFKNSTGSSYTTPIGGFSNVTYDNGLKIGKNNSNEDEIKVVLENYDLWIGGDQVTSANASNFFNAKNNGSPTVSFNSNTNTLTLNGPDNIWVSGDEPGIKSGLPNLTIFVADGTSFQFNGNATKAAFEGVNGTETITFDTDPASPAILNVSSAQSNIIKNFQTVTYNNGLSLWKKYDIYSGEYDASIRTAPWTGKGTESNPFHITSFADLQQMATFLNNYLIKLDYFFDMPADVDCSGAAAVFPSIGRRYNNYVIHTFSGTFNGKGNKITNLSSSYGLFTHVGDGGTVKNLTLENCTVTGGTSGSAYYEPAVSAGGVVAELRGSSSKIQNCNVTGGSISGGSNNQVCFVGGIVGDLSSGTVEGCVVNNVTISEPDASRTPRQGVGGIVGLLEGTVSGCQVSGTTTISNTTSGTNTLYTGAIVGERSSATLSNNTYDASVQVTQNDITKSGNAQRGTGEADANGDYDVFENGAVLAGVKKMTVSVATNGSVEFVDGYYRVNGNDVYALPYSVSNQLTRIKGTSGVDYDSPAITITPTGAAAISPTSTTTGSDATTGADNATWSIPMPDVDATAAVTFPIDLGNGSREFTIDDFTYNGSGQAVTEIKTKKTSTSTNEITLSLTNGDITFVDYLSSTGETIGPNPPSAAGNYKISIKTGNKTIGSCEVAYKINAATATITAGDQKVTYTGAGQAYSGVTNCPGSYSVTYYPSETDRTNNSNGYTTPLPVNADDYFVRVTQTDPNYTSSPVDAKFTIEAIEAQFTWGATQFDYDGNPHAPTASVSNIVDGDACSVTVSGQQTNVGSSYTATISGLGSTNYKLPATAPSTTFSINPIAVGLNWTNTVFTFDGDAHKPTATATGLKGSDVCNVTVTGEQTNASETSYTATATALDNNNYKLPTTGLTQDFTISPCSLATATIATIDAQTYSGSEIKPTPEVKITLGTSTSETTLSAETDFEYTYANNKNAAKANDNLPPTVTITGKGNYNGTRVVKFTIDQVDMSTSTDITIEAVPDQTYTGSAITPTPTVKFKGNDLVAGAGNDFVYGYLNNINLASSTDPTAPPTVTITGNGNFKNTTSVKFTIKEQEASVNFGTRDYITFYNSTTGNLLVPDDVKAYIVTGVNGNEVVVDQVSFITPNTPVLLEKSPGWTNVKDNVLHSGNLLKYATADVNTDGKQYVLYSGEFVKATGTIPAGKVYLELPSSPARTLVIGRNNAATGVDAISNEAADGEDKWYDMQGRQINKPSKAGLYIKNGKKVVVNNK